VNRGKGAKPPIGGRRAPPLAEVTAVGGGPRALAGRAEIVWRGCAERKDAMRTWYIKASLPRL
jgi:hypothetical protein